MVSAFDYKSSSLQKYAPPSEVNAKEVTAGKRSGQSAKQSAKRKSSEDKEGNDDDEDDDEDRI